MREASAPARIVVESATSLSASENTGACGPYTTMRSSIGCIRPKCSVTNNTAHTATPIMAPISRPLGIDFMYSFFTELEIVI